MKLPKPTSWRFLFIFNLVYINILFGFIACNTETKRQGNWLLVEHLLKLINLLRKAGFNNNVCSNNALVQHLLYYDNPNLSFPLYLVDIIMKLNLLCITLFFRLQEIILKAHGFLES